MRLIIEFDPQYSGERTFTEVLDWWLRGRVEGLQTDTSAVSGLTGLVHRVYTAGESSFEIGLTPTPSSAPQPSSQILDKIEEVRERIRNGKVHDEEGMQFIAAWEPIEINEMRRELLGWISDYERARVGLSAQPALNLESGFRPVPEITESAPLVRRTRFTRG